MMKEVGGGRVVVELEVVGELVVVPGVSGEGVVVVGEGVVFGARRTQSPAPSTAPLHQGLETA
jgi:hypothetical protein